MATVREEGECLAIGRPTRVAVIGAVVVEQGQVAIRREQADAGDRETAARIVDRPGYGNHAAGGVLHRMHDAVELLLSRTIDRLEIVGDVAGRPLITHCRSHRQHILLYPASGTRNTFSTGGIRPAGPPCGDGCDASGCRRSGAAPGHGSW